MNKLKMYQYSVDAVGSAYGLANIQTILGIIVLVLSIFNVLLNATVKIITLIKKRQIEAIPEVIDDTIEKLEEVEKNEKSK